MATREITAYELGTQAAQEDCQNDGWTKNPYKTDDAEYEKWCDGYDFYFNLFYNF